MAKFGEGHVSAMGRLGLKELRNAVNPSRESVADNEIGLYGTLTQGEIATARGGPGAGAEQEQAASSRGKMTMEQFYEHATAKAQEAAQRMDNQHQNDRQRGGIEM